MDISKNKEGYIEINGIDKKKILEQGGKGLSYYEVVCAPREVSKEKEIQISDDKVERIVKEILRWNICYDMYQDPGNIKA